MDGIEQLEHLQAELTARGLSSKIDDKPHWSSLDPVPTLTCCPYLGYAQVTVTEHGLERWLARQGHHKPPPRVFPGLAADDRARHRRRARPVSVARRQGELQDRSPCFRRPGRRRPRTHSRGYPTPP